MWWIWPEFENDVFVFLAYRKFAAFHSRAAHVLVKRINDNKAMRVTEKVSPEALQIIAPCVVRAWILRIVRRGFASNAALITHRFDDALTVIHHEYRHIVSREDARVAGLRRGSLDVVELGSRPFNLVVCDSPTFSRRLRDLALKRTLCIRQASALSEQLLLKLCELCGVKFLDGGLDLALLVRLWIRERVVHCLRYVRFAAFRALPVQPRKLSDGHLSSEHVDVFAIVRLDLRRITHVHLVSGPTTAYKLTVV